MTYDDRMFEEKMVERDRKRERAVDHGENQWTSGFCLASALGRADRLFDLRVLLEGGEMSDEHGGSGWCPLQMGLKRDELRVLSTFPRANPLSQYEGL